jgi:hypothetical protein
MTVVSVYAMNGQEVIANVPFSFIAGEKSFPAGDYTFTVDDPDAPILLAIKNKKGEKLDIMLTQSKNLRKAADQSKLVFEKYGNQSYLSQVWVAGMSTVQVVPQSEIQKEVAEHAGHHETVDVAAHKP